MQTFPNSPAESRVLYVITGLETGGAEAMLWKVLSAADRSRWPCMVVALGSRGTFGPRIEALGVPVVALGLTAATGLPGAIARLRKISREYQPDLVHGWMYHGNLAASAASWLGGRQPILWNIRQSLHALEHAKRATRRMIWAGARLSGGPARIVYNSRVSARQHEAIGYRGDRTVVIPNGFDTMTFRPDPIAARTLRQRLGFGPDDLIVGLVARWHPVKDHPTFLRAAGIIAAEMPNVRFVLAGRGVDAGNAPLAALIHCAGLDGRVSLLGDLDDTAGLTAGFDVACCSSVAEAFPNVLGEALACGVPCVATDVGDASWVVGEAGAIVPAGDPSRFAKACLDLLTAPLEARRNLGDCGRARIEREFGICQVAARYAELYGGILAARSR